LLRPENRLLGHVLPARAKQQPASLRSATL
jgi:hypothetical protein